MAQDDYMAPENDDNDHSNLDVGMSDNSLQDMMTTFQPELTSVGSDHIQNEDEGIEEDHKESSDDKANEETTTQVKNEVIEDPGKSTNEKLKKEKKKHKETLDKDDLQEKKRQRLENLASKRLPNDILEKLDEVKNEKKKSLPSCSTIESETISSNGALHVGLKVNEEKLKKRSGCRKSKKLREFDVGKTLQSPHTWDVIPLKSNSTEFHVNVLNHPVTSVVSDTVSLLELRNRLQFGNPKRRESTIKAAGKITKNALSGRNVRFVTSMPPSK